jgi:hypothetical protein
VVTLSTAGSSGRVKEDQAYDRVVYDLQTGRHFLAGFRIGQRKDPRPEDAWLFGCQTRDDAGNCYAVGVQSGEEGESRNKPILLQVRPPKLVAR